MSEFTVHDGTVWMVGNHKPVRLSDWQCDQLLDLFESAGSADLFNRLYTAQREAMGDLHIPRVSAFRKAPVLVVDNTPDVAAHNFTQAMEQSL